MKKGGAFTPPFLFREPRISRGDHPPELQR